MTETSIDWLKGPLRGLRVLDLGNMIAGPYCAGLLADYGADVVKTEHPIRGDDLRNWPPHKGAEPLWWKVTNRNKRLVTLDISKPRGREAVLGALGKGYDVVVENFRPGTLERWGLSYDELANTNPRVILVRVSGYGQTGPYAHRPGYGTIAEAMSGVPAFTGFPEHPPTLSAFPLVDCVAGLTAATATLAAIYERDNGAGHGQVVDVSLFESFFRLAETQVIAYDQLAIVKERAGNRMAEDSPRNTYQTSDGRYVAISAGSQRTFARLAAAMGRPELAEDPKYASPQARVEHAEELDAHVAHWFEHQTLEDAMRELEAGDVVAGPVYDVRDILADPHYRERDAIVELEDEALGSVRMPGVFPKFSRTPGGVHHPGRAPGADNEWFYRDLLELSEDELISLKQEQIA